MIVGNELIFLDLIRRRRRQMILPILYLRVRAHRQLVLRLHDHIQYLLLRYRRLRTRQRLFLHKLQQIRSEKCLLILIIGDFIII